MLFYPSPLNQVFNHHNQVFVQFGRIFMMGILAELGPHSGLAHGYSWQVANYGQYPLYRFAAVFSQSAAGFGIGNILARKPAAYRSVTDTQVVCQITRLAPVMLHYFLQEVYQSVVLVHGGCIVT
jgi:hypothetical protein